MPSKKEKSRRLGIKLGFGLTGMLLAWLVAEPVTGSIALLKLILSILAGGAGSTWIGGFVGDGANAFLRKILGYEIQVLGAAQAGKNSFILSLLTEEDFPEPAPTRLGTKEKYAQKHGEGIWKNLINAAKTIGEQEFMTTMKNTIELGGEDIQSWKDTLVNYNPEALIFLIDSHSMPTQSAKRYQQEIGKVILAIETICNKWPKKRKLRGIFILVNKLDTHGLERAYDVVQSYERKFNTTPCNNERSSYYGANLGTILRGAVGADGVISFLGYCSHPKASIRSRFSSINKRSIERLFKAMA